MSRSRAEGFDWAVDERAALREQFPALARVMRERPGTAADRANQQLHGTQNRDSLRGARSRYEARLEQEADADRFIAEMQRREREKFLAHLAARHGERKSA